MMNSKQTMLVHKRVASLLFQKQSTMAKVAQQQFANVAKNTNTLNYLRNISGASLISQDLRQQNSIVNKSSSSMSTAVEQHKNSMEILKRFVDPEKNIYTRSEVQKHNKPDDAWIIIDQVVYDVTEYWKVHPGGGLLVLQNAGTDVTSLFREYNHTTFALSNRTAQMIEIGKVEEPQKEGEQYTPPPTFEPEDLEDMARLTRGGMFCQQCSQAMKGTGCVNMGICGKNPVIAQLQDLLVHCNKQLAGQAMREGADKFYTTEIMVHFVKSTFSTLTNVNFDRDAIMETIATACRHRDYFISKLGKDDSPAFKYDDDILYLLEEGEKVGVVKRRAAMQNDDNLGLLEMCQYGLKGVSAYLFHAECLLEKYPGLYADEVRIPLFKELFRICGSLAKQEHWTMEKLLALNMDLGMANFKVITLLDASHAKAFGASTPTEVPRSPIEGKCILISGHDMVCVKELLEQTEGTGINVYTHGELYPAFGYPAIRKHKHLAGNFGVAWYNQNTDFQFFPGPILMTSNCLLQPKKQYKDRIFTTHAVGWPGIPHLKGTDYSQLIDLAKSMPGFTKDHPAMTRYAKPPEITGYGHAQILKALVGPIQRGNVKEIFVIGGCDGFDVERTTYRDTMLAMPKTSVFITMGCAKYKLLGTRKEIGFVPNETAQIPRLLDAGQCNDAYTALKVAIDLAAHLKVGVNDLPLHLLISWMEQKACACLLTMLALGVKKINLGPRLPVWLTPNLAKFLVDNFQLSTLSQSPFYTPPKVNQYKKPTSW